MADINKRKREDNNAEAAGTGVGAFIGDTMASALDPFGSVAAEGAVSGGALDNKSGKGAADDNQGFKTKD